MTVFAAFINEYGEPSVLHYRERKRPVLNAGEVLIKVSASAVNRADLEIRSGNWKIESDSPFPYVPGLETCGVVEEKAADVDLEIGTKVITMMQKMAGIHGLRDGGYQSHVVAPAATLAVVPNEQDLISLATIGLAGVTAFHGINKLELNPNSSVIIHGASGGVGSVAIKLALAIGCRVIAVTNRKSNVDKLSDLGASEVWDLSQKPLKEWCSTKVDAVLEMVGGEIFADSVGCLKRGGRLCSVGALTGGIAHLSIWDLLHDLVLTGWSSENMEQNGLQAAIKALSSMLQSKDLEAPPCKTYELADVASAHRDIESGNAFGRVLLIP
jgi:NADPH2:quinone reductase